MKLEVFRETPPEEAWSDPAITRDVFTRELASRVGVPLRWEAWRRCIRLATSHEPITDDDPPPLSLPHIVSAFRRAEVTGHLYPITKVSWDTVRIISNERLQPDYPHLWLIPWDEAHSVIARGVASTALRQAAMEAIATQYASLPEDLEQLRRRVIGPLDPGIMA